MIGGKLEINQGRKEEILNEIYVKNNSAKAKEIIFEYFSTQHNCRRAHDCDCRFLIDILAKNLCSEIISNEKLFNFIALPEKSFTRICVFLLKNFQFEKCFNLINSYINCDEFDLSKEAYKKLIYIQTFEIVLRLSGVENARKFLLKSCYDRQIKEEFTKKLSEIEKKRNALKEDTKARTQSSAEAKTDFIFDYIDSKRKFDNLSFTNKIISIIKNKKFLIFLLINFIIIIMIKIRRRFPMIWFTSERWEWIGKLKTIMSSILI